MSRNLCTIITALFLSACDPGEAGVDAGKKTETAPAKPEAAASKAGAPAAAVAGSGGAAAPGTVDSLSSCISSCDEPKQLPTDRTTCRLNCENAYGFKPAAPVVNDGGDPVGDAVSCLGRCYSQGGAALGTCTAGCKAVAAAATVAPAPASLDTLSTCLGGCYAEKGVLPTNRATCELTCAQEARVAGPAQPAAPK